MHFKFVSMGKYNVLNWTELKNILVFFYLLLFKSTKNHESSKD